MRNYFIFLMTLGFIGIFSCSHEDKSRSFKIDGIELTLFKIIDYDSSNQCYRLTPINFKDKDSNELLIAVRMSLNWINSNKLSTQTKSSETDEGHVDTIASFNIVDDNGTSILKSLSPAEIKYFKVKDSIIPNHSLSNRNYCYESMGAVTLEQWKDWYNNLSWAHPNITNYFFFQIPAEESGKLMRKKIALSVNFKDGKLLSDTLRYNLQ